MNLYFSYLMIIIGTQLGSTKVPFPLTSSHDLDFLVPDHCSWPQYRNASLFSHGGSVSEVNFTSRLKVVG